MNEVDWVNDEIRLTQNKTSVPLTLPLTASVGNAIYDYITLERPESSKRQIFLGELRPYDPLKASAIFYIASKIYDAAGIRISQGERRGSHLFRYHVATTFIGNGIQRPVVSSKHINNALKEELNHSTVANFATVQMEGGREVERNIEHYNLDMIISAGYRVKSTRGVQFRKCANSILKQYIIQEYAANANRMNQLGEVIRIMKRTENSLDAKQVLSVIEKYSLALDLLDDYDHQTMKRPDGNKAVCILSYEECRQVIDSMKFSTDSNLFGNEKDDSFKGSIGNIYPSFADQDIYGTNDYDCGIQTGRKRNDDKRDYELYLRIGGSLDS